MICKSHLLSWCVADVNSRNCMEKEMLELSGFAHRNMKSVRDPKCLHTFHSRETDVITFTDHMIFKTMIV